MQDPSREVSTGKNAVGCPPPLLPIQNNITQVYSTAHTSNLSCIIVYITWSPITSTKMPRYANFDYHANTCVDLSI